MKYKIKFSIEGHAIIEASSRSEAMTTFDNAVSALGIEHFIEEGYDDLIIGRAVPAEENK
jgi:hypothetical protein